MITCEIHFFIICHSFAFCYENVTFFTFEWDYKCWSFNNGPTSKYVSVTTHNVYTWIVHFILVKMTYYMWCLRGSDWFDVLLKIATEMWSFTGFCNHFAPLIVHTRKVQAICIILIFSISCLRDKPLWCKSIHIYICLRLSNVSLGVRVTLDVIKKEISREIGWYEHWVC